MSFTFNFTQAQLAQMIPGNPHVDHWFHALNEILPEYEINTPQRVAAFIAQCNNHDTLFSLILYLHRHDSIRTTNTTTKTRSIHCSIQQPRHARQSRPLPPQHRHQLRRPHIGQ